MNRDEIINDEAHPIPLAIGGEWRGEHPLSALQDRQHTANCCARFPACRLQAIVSEGFS